SAIRLYQAHRVHPAEDSWAEFCEALQASSGGRTCSARPVQAGPGGLRVADPCESQDHPGIPGIYGRQHLEDEGDVSRSGRRAQQHALRMAANASVICSAGRLALVQAEARLLVESATDSRHWSHGAVVRYRFGRL